jgi:oligopeptide/dipeptide ABC transporter ATP-binding protein
MNYTEDLPVLEVNDIHLQFETSAGSTRVLNDMGFVCRRGQMVGLVGESGSGKTVLAGVLVNHVRRPGKIVSGEVLFNGQDLLKMDEVELQSIRGRQIGMIVAKSHVALNPLTCVGDQIANIYLSHIDATKKEARERALEVITATGINDPEKRYWSYQHELSGGMAKRIIIAAALICEPIFVIADEPTSGLDVTIQAQVLDSMIELINQKKTIGTLLMTRDLGIIAQYCTRVIVTYAGQVIEAVSANRFFRGPIHPYSQLLLASARLDLFTARDVAQMGPPPDKFDLPKGCLFRERCLVEVEKCRQIRPALEEVSPDHLVRCWRKDEL